MIRTEPALSPSAPHATDEPVRLVVFRVDEHRFALPLMAVERVIRAVAITPLPNAPAVVLGVIDVQGQVLPVCDVRERFRVPRRSIRLSDHIAVVRTQRRPLSLLVDVAEGVIERPADDIIGAREIDARLEHLRGIVQLEDGLVLVEDLERFLSTHEAQMLEEALRAEGAHGG